MTMQVTVVGLGADGWTGINDNSRQLIASAEVLIGGPRHLALVPARDGQDRAEWPSPLRAGLPSLLDDLAGRRVVALASGDPLQAGIATTLIDLLGADNVRVVPAVSSVTLARARMNWSAESVTVLRNHQELPAHLDPGARVIVLSADASTPAAVAQMLVAAGRPESVMTALGALGSAVERRIEATASTWSAVVPALHVLAVEVRGGAGIGLSAGLPDEAYEHDGQLTKRDVRASALARLAPARGQLLWDVGAGAGSIGIEWMRAHPTCRAVAIEARSDRAERVLRNAGRLGVPRIEVLHGRAPDALVDLPRPDAVFVGGGATEPGLLDACWAALGDGGRLVVHGVTLETEAVLAERHARFGGELTRLHVEHAAPIGTFTGWTPARAVTQWAVTKGLV